MTDANRRSAIPESRFIRLARHLQLHDEMRQTALEDVAKLPFFDLASTQLGQGLIE
jgi:hypothetical protein